MNDEWTTESSRPRSTRSVPEPVTPPLWLVLGIGALAVICLRLAWYFGTGA